MRFLVAALAGLCLPVWPVVANDLTIGFVGDLSGVGANMAQDQLDGFRLGLKHTGGHLGGNDVSLDVEDSHRDAKAARSLTEHMLLNQRVQVLLASVQPGALPGLTAPAGRTLVLSLNVPPLGLAGRDCSPSFFSLAPLNETLHDLAGQLLQQRGYKTVVLAGLDNENFHAAAAAVRRTFKGQVVEVFSRRGEMNFSKNLHQIRQASPDAVYLLHTGGMAVNFIRQYVEAQPDERPPMIGPATVFDQAILAAVGSPAVDLTSVGPWSEDMDTPVNKRFLTEFESDYGRPASLYAAIGYDGAMLLDAAFKAVDRRTNDEDALRNAMRRVEFLSTRGAVRFDTNQLPIESYLVRQVVEDSRGRIVNEQRGLLARDVRDGHANECPMRW